MATYQLCDLFNITLKETQARREFIGFTPEDEENLNQINSVIREEVDTIIPEFYAHLSRFEELRRFLSDRHTLERLQKTQRKYLVSLGQDADQLAYFEERLRIGLAHEQVGLKQKWYLGAYCRLFELISHRLATRYTEEPDKLLSMLITLYKILTLDSELGVETYYQATTQRLENILHQLTEAQHKLQEVSRLDGLTQVNNRKFLMEALEMELHRSQRFCHPFTLLLVDIDHFKEINDRHGHAFGDFILQKTVQLIRSGIRPADIIGRYGGEEFAIGLVECDESVAHQIAERIRLKVALTAFEFKQTSAFITVSIGLATLNVSDQRIEALIERADRALYQAKEAGRNQVCVSKD